MNTVELKRAAAMAAVELVEDGMRVGIGTGTTARPFIVGLGDAVRRGLRITAVATSRASAELAEQEGIRLVELDGEGLDIAVDGADQVDPELRLVKGGGGAHVRERIVAAAARRFVVIVDETKIVERLTGPIPIELLEFGAGLTLARLSELGAPFELRVDDRGVPLRSDSGNLLADGRFGVIDDSVGLAARMDAVPGLVDHGLFLGMADLVLVGDNGGVREIRPR